MTTLVAKVEHWIVAEAKTGGAGIETLLEQGWQEVKPAILLLGKTVLSQIEQAALAYFTGLSGGPQVAFADAVASVVSQLPGDAKQLEAIVAGAMAAHVGKLSAAP